MINVLLFYILITIPLPSSSSLPPRCRCGSWRRAEFFPGGGEGEGSPAARGGERDGRGDHSFPPPPPPTFLLSFLNFSYSSSSPSTIYLSFSSSYLLSLLLLSYSSPPHQADVLLSTLASSNGRENECLEAPTNTGTCRLAFLKYDTFHSKKKRGYYITFG